jgi:hypothetical protein
MSETLFVRLPPGAEPGVALEWVLLDDVGARLDQGVHVGLAQLPAPDTSDGALASVEVETAPSPFFLFSPAPLAFFPSLVWSI